MKILCSLALAVASATVLSGCGNLNAINFPFHPDDGTSLSIDAKQRTVYTVEKTYWDAEHRDAYNQPTLKYKWRAICAEPSPDALSALSVAAGADASVAGKALSGAFSSSEAAASIGLRTQTIQILRDAMYRLCEGYASGALDDIGYTRLQRRYQNIMLGLLAIEQITGAVSAKQAVLSGTSAASLARSLAEIQSALADATSARDDAKDALTKAEADKKTKNAALATAKTAVQTAKDADTKNSTDETKKALSDAQSNLAAAQKASDDADLAQKKAENNVKYAQANVDALQDMRSRAGKVATSASSTGAFDGGGYVSVVNSATAETISTAVTNIVRDITLRDYSKETCLDAVLSRDFKSFDPAQFKVAVLFCTMTLQAEASQLAQQAAAKGVDTPAGKAAQQHAAEIAASAKLMQDALKDIAVPAQTPKPPAQGN